MRFGEARREPRRFAVGGERRLPLAAVAAGTGEVVVRGGVPWLELDRAAQQSDGLVQLPALGELGAELKAVLCASGQPHPAAAEQPLQHGGCSVPSTQVTA